MEQSGAALRIASAAGMSSAPPTAVLGTPHPKGSSDVGTVAERSRVCDYPPARQRSWSATTSSSGTPTEK